ncbi:MAG TPA: hypothetical protein VGS12_09260 [Caulobacteraceae bacterium]|nr:hypothetical protein [Caulobacteraceae bacterium]
MTRREMSTTLVGAAVGAAAPAPAAVSSRAARMLPAPSQQGGMPLLSALKLRRSTRAY